MVTLDLSASEQAVLWQVLETAVSDLGTEIGGTDDKEFRDDLKARREVLYKVVAALGDDAPPSVQATKASAPRVRPLPSARRPGTVFTIAFPSAASP